MSGLGDPSGTRLVPMNASQANALDLIGGYMYGHGFPGLAADAYAMKAAYDAAPADPAEAVREIYFSTYASQDAFTADVLRVLGWGAANPANEDHHA